MDDTTHAYGHLRWEWLLGVRTRGESMTLVAGTNVPTVLFAVSMCIPGSDLPELCLDVWRTAAAFQMYRALGDVGLIRYLEQSLDAAGAKPPALLDGSRIGFHIAVVDGDAQWRDGPPPDLGQLSYASAVPVRTSDQVDFGYTSPWAQMQRPNAARTGPGTGAGQFPGALVIGMAAVWRVVVIFVVLVGIGWFVYAQQESQKVLCAVYRMSQQTPGFPDIVTCAMNGQL